MKERQSNRRSEHGGAGVKVLAFIFFMVLAAHAGYNFLLVIYNAENLKQEMQTAVVQGVIVPNPRLKPVEIVKKRIESAIVAYNIPEDAEIQIKQVKNSIHAHVSYSQPVPVLPFDLYTYEYQFDHTATPSGFLIAEQ